MGDPLKATPLELLRPLKWLIMCIAVKMSVLIACSLLSLPTHLWTQEALDL